MQKEAFTPSPVVQIQNRLVALGWTKEQGAAIASKSFPTAVGPRVAFAYATRGNARTTILAGTYWSEGRNILSSEIVLADDDANEIQLHAATAGFAATVDRSVGDSYAARLLANGIAISRGASHDPN